jgi:hypothetical protein
MPELEIDHFHKRQPTIADDPSVHSTDAPSRPAALLDPLHEQFDTVELEEPRVPYIKEAPSPPQQQLTTFQRSPLARINFDKIEGRRELMQELHDTIPLNEFNLPRYIYRVDLLDHAVIAEAARNTFATTPTISPPEVGPSHAHNALQEALDAAIVHLEYVHGYPTFKSGQPLWSQMPHESSESFSAFCEYLSLPGVRILTDVKQAHVSIASEYFQFYYWHFRATAYDMYRQAHHDRMRVQRIMDTEDNHYLEGAKLFSRLSKALEGVDDEVLREMDPEKLLSMLEKAAKLQRISAGLNSQGGQAPETSPVNVEVRMKQIAKDNTQVVQIEDSFDSDLLLANPETLETAQELILKINK